MLRVMLMLRVVMRMVRVRVAVPGVGGPWALFSLCYCYPWLGVLLVPGGGAAGVCLSVPPAFVVTPAVRAP